MEFMKPVDVYSEPMTLYLSSQTVVGLALTSLFFGVACGGSTEADLDRTSGTGGVATGGAQMNASGGVSASGGAQASGGSTSSGGAEATGGVTSTGGSEATGGIDAGGACVPNGNSGLQPELLALELSDEEMTSMCEAIVTEAEAVDAQCTITGVLFASFFSTNDDDFQAACRQFEAECHVALEALDCSEPDPLSADCEATVCDYEVCLAQTIEGAKTLNCTMSRAEASAYIASNMAQTPECDRVNACDVD